MKTLHPLTFSILAQCSFVSLSIFTALSAHAGKMTGVNNPALFDEHYEYHLNQLPLKGSLATEQLPWSETYWPNKEGSINVRWNAPGAPGFSYHLYTKDEVKAMSREELKKLSPSEKFDLALGHYNYPLVAEVYDTRAKKDAADWEGLCDGWTNSAIQFKEPKPKDIVNPDGIVIPFGSSDIKAILAYYTSMHDNTENVQVGAYCGRWNRIACKELNPGAYHVILANEIGLKHKGFASNIESGRQIWNQPVYGFEFQIVGSGVPSGLSKNAVHVKASMTYGRESESSWDPGIGTDQFASNSQEVEYILNLDDDGKITGGYWLTKKVHPDNFWKPTQKITFTGDYQLMNQFGLEYK